MTLAPNGSSSNMAHSIPRPRNYAQPSRVAVVMIGLFTLVVGIILSSIPWLDYIILKNLKLRDGSLSFHYWQKPGVIRLTKVYIFNVTNADNFLALGEKPKLQEIGPFVYSMLVSLACVKSEQPFKIEQILKF
ncbi:hypothetical protein NQ318_002230 [Aromia moschata]|uniref:Scavenger receptor class B member 1 n=1 Tax=Aromia moschata TaxID=1265417 RepID=A0AAV8Z3A6_9CUCU|nr:hypothetical protein NQ318_002230 [Aromia moschata]